MKKVSIVGSVGVPACYGGFETLAENLLDHDGEKKFIVYCSSKAYSQKQKFYKNAELIYIPINANGVYSIFYDGLSMLYAALDRSSVILILGVSGALFIPFIKMFSSAKFICNIDGLEWRRQKWGWLVRKYLKFSERLAVVFSDVVIADNLAVAQYVRSEYKKDCEVIAYGGNHVLTRSLTRHNAGYALSICRIEPENNIHVILRAFSLTGVPLKIVGNWQSSEYGRSLRNRYSNISSIELIDPIYDLDILFFLRDQCSFYVHGHSAGGTNPSLVEIMFFAKPVIAFDCEYNRATLENHGDYFKTSEDLLEAINGLQDGRALVGVRLAEIAWRRYSWDRIRALYTDLFN